MAFAALSFPPPAAERFVMAETFGEMVLRLRTERKWSQDYLGKLIDSSHVRIGDWERQKRNPESREVVIQLAEAFGVDPDPLLVAADYAPLQPEEKGFHYRKERLAFFRGQPFFVDVPEAMDDELLNRVRTVVEALIADAESAQRRDL